MTRLLITGATGFLGVPCVARAASDCDVHAVGRTNRDVLPRGARFHRLDLFDPAAVTSLLVALRPTHLLHLAWIATPGAYWTSPENHRWAEASKHLITAFREHGGTRAVIAGTCAEYDWNAAERCREFTTPIRPATLYGQCKNELRAWAEACGVSTAWARLFFLYGPREHPARLVPSVARALLNGDVAECSAGTQERDFLHVDDVADALVALVRSGLTGPVNIGSGVGVSVRSVIERVAVSCGRPELVRLGAKVTPPSEPARLIAGIGRLRDELGWRPRIALGNGLSESVNWWRCRRAA